MKRNYLLPILQFFIFYSVAKAQSYVGISTGISRDLNNIKESFYHIPVSIQWKPFGAVHNRPVFLELDYDIPFPANGSDNAYTLNSSLPQQITLQKEIRAYVFTASIGFIVPIYRNKKSNSLYLNLLPVGICNQSFKVEYNKYDKANYTILNRDVNTHLTSLVTSMEAQFNFHRKFMIMLHLQSPLLANRGDYPLSYRFVAPLQFTFGYNFIYHSK